MGRGHIMSVALPSVIALGLGMSIREWAAIPAICAPDASFWGPLRVNWNSHLQRYQAFINNGNLIACAESPDGLTWSVPTVLKDFSNDPNQPGFYITPVGLGDDPSILGKQFDILYTYYPNNGQGWNGA